MLKKKELEQVVNAAVVSVEAGDAMGWPEGLSPQGWWHSPAHHGSASQPGWKEWRNILGAAACHAGMEQGMGSRMRSNRMRGSKDPEPLRNPVVLQLEPLHLRQLH